MLKEVIKLTHKNTHGINQWIFDTDNMLIYFFYY